MRLFALLAAACLASGVLKAQDAKAIVDKMAQTTRALKSYRIAGKLDLSAGRGAEKMYSGAKLRAAVAEEGGKVRLEYDGSAMRLVVVSNGSKTWTYLPETKKYMQVEAATAAAGEGDEEDDANAAFNALDVMVRKFAAFDKIPIEAQLAGQAKVKTAQGAADCWIVLCKLPNQTNKLWIDKQRSLVLKSETVISSKAAPIQVMTAINSFEQGLPASEEFLFTVPKGAQLVEDLEIPGSPRRSLVGRPAIDFRLKNTAGEPLTLSDHRGKIVLLDFWATWCPPCRKELPMLNQLATELKDQGVEVIGISDEDAGIVRHFAEKNKHVFPTVIDSRSQAHKAYAAKSIPSLFILNKQGIVVKHMVGARSEEELRKAIAFAQADNNGSAGSQGTQ